MKTTMRFPATFLFLGLAGCPSPPATVPPQPEPKAAAMAYDKVPRIDFNRLAAELNLPWFWIADANEDGAVAPDEIAVLWGVSDTPRSGWVADGFTPDFDAAYTIMVTLHEQGPTTEGLDAAEVERRALVRKELSQGRPTLVHTSFSGGTAQDQAIVEHILKATALIERIHHKQTGALGLDEQLGDDPASRMMYYRNQGPWCVAPQTENEANCHAIAAKPAKVFGLYPAALQANDKFCDVLKNDPNEKLRHQFYVVRGEVGALAAVPYHEAYAEEMKAISAELTAAAAAIQTEDEVAFKTYLTAAARAFLDDSWPDADEAWANMNLNNSKWYLRIGPDEVYFEPCNSKAGFHVSFARINQDSVRWQKKLEPVKTEMEQELARLAGAPYKAREVSFHLPDFIDIVLNAGDSRSAHGATIGQSLPNWGPVANEGRGRTVVMTNLYTDPDSKVELRKQASSLFCEDTMTRFSDDADPMVMSIVLHEAAHNLGPAAEYKVGGKTARDIFGGPTASTMEELKAQTAALYFTNWLVDKRIIDKKFAEQTQVRDAAWAFNHMARGLYTASGQPKSYSQLAAIQMGFLEEQGALQWRAETPAANGSDSGCYSIDSAKWAASTTELMTRVAKIKATGDTVGAKALISLYVDVDGTKKARLETIQERWLRAPKASFVYSIEL